MFELSGIAATGLGALADASSIENVFSYCAYLPLLEVITILLPAMKRE
jgi:FSR family fosmidomycin resistance protein-like MFS transporter